MSRSGWMISNGAAACLLLICGTGTARADDTTAAEIALLKAQLRRLEAKVDQQDRRERGRSRAQQQAGVGGSRESGTTSRVAAKPGAATNTALAGTVKASGAQVYGEGPLPTFLPCPPKALCYKGLTFTPGGYVAAETVTRSRNLAADVDSPFGLIPFRNSQAGRTGEFRFSARSTRLSGLIEGNVDPLTHIAAFGEFDFLGAAQTANENESNSFTPRIRHLYATVDRSDYGLHLLAGQSWSLATMFAKGLEVRKEEIPNTIDLQYVPGFIWARQPQVRIVKDISPILSVGVSAENPATTESGTLPAAFTYNQAPAAGGGFNSANSLSLNHVPDLVAKVAYDPTVGGHDVHIEGFGLGRDFYSRSNTSNEDVIGGGGGGSLLVQVMPKLLDLQVSGAVGAGLGRYGTSQLPDITVSANGKAKPLSETLFLTGATLHATPSLDFYTYAGMEQEARSSQGSVGGVNYGYGNALNSNAGCDIEGSTATCTGNTRMVRQITAGLWDTVYSGGFGQLRAGLQYSYTQRFAFSSTQGGAPKTDENTVFTSLRYYPF